MRHSLLLLPLLLALAACGASDAVGDLLDPPDTGNPRVTYGSVTPLLPTPSGPCPEITSGTVTFHPAGIAARDVVLWVPAAATPPGGLTFYWHGTGSAPAEAIFGLGLSELTAYVASGGIVAAPVHDPDAGVYPWFLTTVGGGTGRMDDLIVADEVVACIQQKRGLDARQIHSVGMSAGALQTTNFAYLRSDYLASVVTYSGGLIPQLPVPRAEEPTNPFPALIFDGGPTDTYTDTASGTTISFQQASEGLFNDLRGSGHFAAICDHGQGHTIPFDAAAFVWQFLDAHPYDRVPEPWTTLPASAPSYCALSL